MVSTFTNVKIIANFTFRQSTWMRALLHEKQKHDALRDAMGLMRLLGHLAEEEEVPVLDLFNGSKGDSFMTPEIVRNFTGAGFFISKLYPKVSELRQFCNCNKTA